jgi:hypothetical protein
LSGLILNIINQLAAKKAAAVAPVNQNAEQAIVGGLLQATFLPGQAPQAPAGGQLQATFNPTDPLPDDGRLILTAEKRNPQVQPFKPNQDYILALVSAALVDPCVMPLSPPTDDQAGQLPPGTRVGYRVYQPGDPSGDGTANSIKVNQTTDETQVSPITIPTNVFVGAFGGLVGAAAGLTNPLGIDGYKHPPTDEEIPDVTGAINDPR